MCEGSMEGRNNINAVKEGVVVEKVFLLPLPALPVHLSLRFRVWVWTKSVIVKRAGSSSPDVEGERGESGHGSYFLFLVFPRPFRCLSRGRAEQRDR